MSVLVFKTNVSGFGFSPMDARSLSRLSLEELQARLEEPKGMDVMEGIGES